MSHAAVRIAVAVAIVVVTGIVVGAVVLSTGDRSERLSLGAVAQVDQRVPRAITVKVLSSTSVRLTFESGQAPTPGPQPGLTEFPALTYVFVESVVDDIPCSTQTDRERFLSFVRKWGAGSVRSVPKPTEVIDALGRPPIERAANARKGAHIDIELGRPLPDHVCVSAFSSVGDGGRGIFGDRGAAEL